MHKFFTLSRQLLLASLVSVTGSFVQANNVQVALEGSLLTAFGDNAANHFSVVQSIEGVTVSGFNGTTINGLPSLFLPGALLNAAEIRGEFGNDHIMLAGLEIANDLYINLGDGNDRLETFGPITVGANLTVEAGANDDTLSIVGATVFEDTFIDGGLGTLSATISNCMLGKSLTVISDAANDRVTVTGATISQVLAIETKGGNDSVSIASSTSFSAFVSADAGTDTISINGLLTNEDVEITTGLGNDTVNLMNVASGKSIKVNVDEGNDSVSGSVVSAVEDAVFEGGAGRDTFTDRQITAGIKKEIKDFEVRR